MRLNRKFISLLIFVAAFVFFQSCDSNNPYSIDFSSSPPPFDTTLATADTTLPGNIKVYTIRKGNGPFSVVSNDRLQVRFTGRTKKGKIIDGSYTNSNSPEQPDLFNNLTPNSIPTPSRRSISPLVEGLRKGLIGMKEGEKRTIIVPPDMGYANLPGGRIGTYGNDLRNSTLIYDVELVNIL